eukprot:gene20343-25820_t
MRMLGKLHDLAWLLDQITRQREVDDAAFSQLVGIMQTLLQLHRIDVARGVVTSRRESNGTVVMTAPTGGVREPSGDTGGDGEPSGGTGGDEEPSGGTGGDEEPSG